MKNKKPSKKVVNNGCFTVKPPWLLSKTKHDAYRKGELEGYKNRVNEAREENRHQIENLELKLKDSKLEALRVISNSGATIIDAMAHALTAYLK